MASPFNPFKVDTTKCTVESIITQQIEAQERVYQGQLPPMTEIQKERFERFLLPGRKDYNHQYFNIYNSRLTTYKQQFAQELRALLRAEADANPTRKTTTTKRNSGTNNKPNRKSRGDELDDFADGNTPICRHIPEAKPQQRCVILGITFKDMEKKPTILDDQSFKHSKQDDSHWTVNGFTEDGTFTNKDNAQIFVQNEKTYVSPNDVLYLEDTNGRVPLLFTPESYIHLMSSDNAKATGTMNDNESNRIQANASSQKQELYYLNTIVTPAELVTGMLTAVEGELCETTGEFKVYRIFFPNLRFAPQFNPKYSKPQPDDEYVAFVSGLNLSQVTTHQKMVVDPSIEAAMNQEQREKYKNYRKVVYPYEYVEMFLDFVTGSLSSTSHETGGIFSKITTCVIAGNLIGANTAQQELIKKLEADLKKKARSTTTKSKNVEPTEQQTTMNLADQFLTRLASHLDVYLLPGMCDPTNYTLPQQAFHPCLFPSASTYHTFHGVTNPMEVNLGGVDANNSCTITGTDGSPITNITKFSTQNSLSALSLTALSLHLAPTAPDTMGSYPYLEYDPLSMLSSGASTTQRYQTPGSPDSQHTSLPDVIFAGNAPHYGTLQVQMGLKGGPTDVNEHYAQLISIPNFSTTLCFVLMNKRTKQCIPVYLGDDGMEFDTHARILGRENVTEDAEEVRASIDFGEDEEGGDGGE